MLILVEFSVLRFIVYDEAFTCTISYFSSSLLPVVTFFFVCVKLPTISRPKCSFHYIIVSNQNKTFTLGTYFLLFPFSNAQHFIHVSLPTISRPKVNIIFKYCPSI